MDQKVLKVHKELLGFQDLTDQLDQQELKGDLKAHRGL
jgi:hypothetical protein